MIASVIHFYSGGITVGEAKSMPLSELNRYLVRADEMNKRAQE